MIDNNYYSSLEEHYPVNYPKKNGATYSSPLNYSDDLQKTKQRWYRYKEGYSLSLVESIINEYGDNNNKGIILDPFLGSGTTIIGSNLSGRTGIGFEVNPFTCFLAQLKTKQLNNEDIDAFKKAYLKIINSNINDYEEYPLPDLSFSQKIFDENIRRVYMRYRQAIEMFNGVVKDYLMLGWISILEEISNYRKAGNGLKIRKTKKKKQVDINALLMDRYNHIFEDLVPSFNGFTFNNCIFQDSSLNLSKYVKDNSIEGAIFSPPYANCFDYTEIYKLELWFGGFVSNREHIHKLRNEALRSNLNSCNASFKHKTDDIDYFINNMDDTVWDSRIPNMLRGYFDDMYTVLDLLYKCIRDNGFVSIVVGNSTYGGVVIPTDLLLSKYAESIGFKVDKIEIDRFIIPSSQQYHKTKDKSMYIRESVVCLVKK